MKCNAMKYGVILILFFMTGNAIAADFIPKIGINLGRYELWSFEGELEDEVDIGFAGLTGGMLVNFDSIWTDLTLEVNDVENLDGDSMTRSEAAWVLGWRLYKNLSLVGGYRHGTYGDSAFDSDIGTISGPVFGLAVANLTMGDDNKDIFSISLMTQLADVEFEDTNGVETEDSSDAAHIKIGYSRAGSNAHYYVKYQFFSTDESVEESMFTFNISYLFR